MPEGFEGSQTGGEGAFVAQLNLLVQEGNTSGISDIIDDLEAKIADLEAHAGDPKALDILRKRKEVAESARERAWMIR